MGNKTAMTLKITTLVENSAGEHHGLKNEHGIAFLVERDGEKILFDCGQSPAFIDNARQLRANLADVSQVVLSHGHYDHSGGFTALAEVSADIRLFTGEGFFVDKYGSAENLHEFLGNSFDAAFLERKAIAHRTVDCEMLEIAAGMYLLGRFPRSHPDEIVNSRFVLHRNNTFEPDLFNDEILLAIETPKGLVVLLGCSHPGLKNMLDAVAQRLNRPIFAILGGTHLVEADRDSLGLSMEYLQRIAPAICGVSHCTGEKVIDHLSRTYEGFFHNRTGSVLFI
jgi:7,8-dihydropterin-6-yl-methyl-4-(beta-D-ribofuranosyl)aminobenzene 5'-phosphate synthase